jgi:hypothetical protein
MKTNTEADEWREEARINLVLLGKAEKDAQRYRWLRNRDLNAIDKGGLFVGMTPENIVLNGEDLDKAIDVAMGNGG